MTTKYYGLTLELLGLAEDDAYGEPPLTEWAAEHGVAVPEACIEWARFDRTNILGRNSNDDDFFLDDPELVTLGDGRRGLLFCRENQGNFDMIVMLDEGDDPSVLFAWLGEQPWVQYSERFSQAVFCQIFDWQYMLEFVDDEKEITYYTSFNVQTRAVSERLGPQLERLPRTATICEGAVSTQRRMVLESGARVVTEEGSETANVRVLGPDTDVIDQAEDQLLGRLRGQLIPPEHTCVLFALLALDRHLSIGRSTTKLSSLFLNAPKDQHLKALQKCVGEHSIETLRTPAWDTDSESEFELSVPVAGVQLRLVRKAKRSWQFESIS